MTALKLAARRILGGAGRTVFRFFCEPASAKPLGVFRIAFCSVLLLQGLLVGPGLHELYGEAGLIQSSLSHFLSHPFTLGIAELSQWFRLLGFEPRQVLELVYVVYLASLSCLLIGWHTRLNALLVYFLHSALFYYSGFLSSYGADTYAHIFFFYFMFFPVNRAYSLDMLRKELDTSPNPYNRLSLRVAQCTIAIYYCVSGIAKSLGDQWWNGEVIWRSLTVPQFSQFDVQWLAHVPWIAILFGWGTLVLEVGYPLFAFHPKTRPYLVVSMVLLHGGIFFGLGLHTFSLLMIVINISLFGIQPETMSAERKGENLEPRLAV